MRGLARKRYVGAVCALLLFLLLCGLISLPVRALDKVDPNEKIAVTAGTPPSLTVSCGDTSILAEVGSYQSKGTTARAVADAMHPLYRGGERIALPVLYRDEGTRFLPLTFSKPPQSVTARRCLSSDRGKAAPDFAQTAYRGGVLAMSDLRGDSSYEVYAEWGPGEHAYYFFEIKAAAPAAIAMQTTQALHSPRDPKVTVQITNNSKTENGYGMEYTLERLKNGSWKSVSPGEREFPAVACIVFAGETREDQIKLTDNFPLPAPNGFYRVGKYLAGYDKPSYAEFEVGPRPDDFSFPAPASITVSYHDKNGRTVSAPLERKGKFGGSSPFVYVSGRLSKLAGAPLCDTPAVLPPDELTLTVRYPMGGGTGGTRIYLYSDGTMQTSTGFYNTGDTSTYTDIKACAASLTVD